VKANKVYIRREGESLVTPRELEVVEQMSCGKSVKEAACILGISWLFGFECGGSLKVRL
jgi:DNA-binding NarL/FixJ family response regulator